MNNVISGELFNMDFWIIRKKIIQRVNIRVNVDSICTRDIHIGIVSFFVLKLLV